MMNKQYYWWCPQCEVRVDGKDVTYEERHGHCGTKVVAIEEEKGNE